MSDATFYLIKGLVALVATVGVVVHMNLSWSEFDKDDEGVSTGIGQRLRYLSWFQFIILIAAASKEQIDDAVAIEKRNVGGLYVAVFALATVIVSIIEARRKRQRRH